MAPVWLVACTAGCGTAAGQDITRWPNAPAAQMAPMLGRNLDRLPRFSWERVPLYMHIRKDTAFTAEEIRYLASFPLVTLEKTTGARDSGSTEAGTLSAARAIKQINPATNVFKGTDKKQRIPLRCGLRRVGWRHAQGEMAG